MKLFYVILGCIGLGLGAVGLGCALVCQYFAAAARVSFPDAGGFLLCTQLPAPERLVPEYQTVQE